MDVVDKYNAYYFSQHPRAKKKQIEHPYHPSINVWSIKPRIQMNALKQTWKQFIMWWIKDLGYENLGLDNVEIEYDIYHPTKRRTDPDNYSPKFIHDGFVETSIQLLIIQPFFIPLNSVVNKNSPPVILFKKSKFIFPPIYLLLVI